MGAYIMLSVIGILCALFLLYILTLSIAYASRAIPSVRNVNEIKSILTNTM